jgi:prevent-host-death family protein
MSKSTSSLDLNVDLQGGVVPISRAASALAALIKRSNERQQPIIVTQKGYPTGVLLPINLYTTLRDLAQGKLAVDGAPANDVLPSPPMTFASPVASNGASNGGAPQDPALTAASHQHTSETEELPVKRRSRGGRKPKPAQP